MFKNFNKKKMPWIVPAEHIPRGQVILEFTFCMIVVLIMIYGVTKVFQWTGRDLAERRAAHDSVLTGGGSPDQQISPFFHSPVKMDAIWDGT